MQQPIGSSPRFLDILRMAAHVAPTALRPLLTGETGTGKEVLARYIHAHSPRAEKPFVAVNCGAIPETLFEAAFFGHKKGAFTSASADSMGLILSADKGTLFLDEIGELPLPCQAKLLRVLQPVRGRLTSDVTPVGDTHPRAVDVRIIAATNVDLWSEVKAKRFRSDLFWRLRDIEIKIPALRERREDIVALAESLLEDYDLTLTFRAKAKLRRHRWPGNIRELQQVIRVAAEFRKFAGAKEIDMEDLLFGEFEDLGVPDLEPVSPRSIPCKTKMGGFVWVETPGTRLESTGGDQGVFVEWLDGFVAVELLDGNGARRGSAYWPLADVVASEDGTKVAIPSDVEAWFAQRTTALQAG